VQDPIFLVRTARTEFAGNAPRSPAHEPPGVRHAFAVPHPPQPCWPPPPWPPLPLALAQTPIKFQLDWRFEGPAALFLASQAKGYYKAAGLDVTIDAGNGSGGTVTRVASGTYDMGFADLAALMEFHANNPDAPNKPVAVMMVYNNTPAAVLALKKSGITKPADLNGKKLGAPGFDAGRKAFPIFAKANNISGVQWTSMDPPLRETMLVRGDIEAITGFSFTSLLNLEARGVKAEDIVVLPYPRTASSSTATRSSSARRLHAGEPGGREGLPERLQPRAPRRSWPTPTRPSTTSRRATASSTSAWKRRLRMAIDAVVASPDAKRRRLRRVVPGAPGADGLAGVRRLRHQDRINPDAVWTDAFLPPKAELQHPRRREEVSRTPGRPGLAGRALQRPVDRRVEHQAGRAQRDGLHRELARELPAQADVAPFVDFDERLAGLQRRSCSRSGPLRGRGHHAAGEQKASSSPSSVPRAAARAPS
jgi:NitT/TauT family transport system substrate-binding protein